MIYTTNMPLKIQEPVVAGHEGCPQNPGTLTDAVPGGPVPLESGIEPAGVGRRGATGVDRIERSKISDPMNHKTARLFAGHPWQIIEEQHSADRNMVAESIFSLSNESMGVRGIFEEGFPARTLEGCYIAGLYFKEKTAFEWKRVAFPNYMNSMVHATNWLKISVEIGGETFRMDESRVAEYRRVLDMKTACLWRELVFTTRAGAQTRLRWERFLSLDDRHLGVQRLSVRTLNHAEPVRVVFQLDGTKGNQTEVTKTGIHSDMAWQSVGPEGLALGMKIRSTGQYHAHRMQVRIDAALNGMRSACSQREKVVEQEVVFTPDPDREYHFEKLVSVWSSRDAGLPHGLIPKEQADTVVDAAKENEILEFLREKSREHLRSCVTVPYEELKSRHGACMEKIWEEADVEIEGDIFAQQGIRYCLFQLLNTYRGGDPCLNIGAKGLTGEVYDGRTFWDTESYCVPFYIHTHPEAARRLLEYRYNTLDAARARARQFGYKGAMYPFTTIDGTEDCVVWDLAFSELHINAIIPFAIYQYVRATGDAAYLYNKGAEVLVEQARFWADRARFIPYRNGYGLNRVTGPDEWHVWTNNNFYTNTMAKWVLEYGAEVVAEMRDRAPEALAALRVRAGFDPEETLHWRKVADKMILNHDEKLGVFPQDDMFFSLDPLSREELDPERHLPLERNWTVEKWYKHDMIKQPDTLLAIFFHRDRFTLEQKRNNYRFYEQRCAHGSSLSPCIHSILAAEVGRYEQAYSYYLWASRLDLDDLQKSAHEGLHISSMAGTWQNIVFGFGGMMVRDGFPEFNPILPEAWQGYSFRVAWRGSVIQVRVDKRQSHFRVLHGGDVQVRVHGREAVIGGKVSSFDLDPGYLQRPVLRGVVLDLDGVIVDTARYHYLAWKKLADREGIYFDERINERLKGVSRMDSLKIIMERSPRKYSDAGMEALAEEKNKDYVRMLDQLTPDDLLPGIPDFLDELKKDGIRVALCSASKNSRHILEKLGVEHYFDVLVTGCDVTNSKPDPEGALLAASKLGLPAADCVMVEDAQADIAAARAAGMKSMGIGYKMDLHEADYVLPSTRYLTLEKIKMLF